MLCPKALIKLSASKPLLARFDRGIRKVMDGIYRLVMELDCSIILQNQQREELSAFDSFYGW